MVYIKEAHAIDSPSPSSFKNIEDPVTLLERQKVAQSCVADLKLPMPAIVDKIDGARFEQLEGPGHYAPIEAPATVAATINTFLHG